MSLDEQCEFYTQAHRAEAGKTATKVATAAARSYLMLCGKLEGKAIGSTGDGRGLCCAVGVFGGTPSIGVIEEIILGAYGGDKNELRDIPITQPTRRLGKARCRHPFVLLPHTSVVSAEDQRSGGSSSVRAAHHMMAADQSS